MRVSQTCVDMVKKFEGLRLDAYPDPATGGDPWTIGYGDTGPDVVPGLRITQEEAERRLMTRLDDDFGEAVTHAIKGVPTTQSQFDAMVSLSYNIGNGGFKGSTVLRMHLAGSYNAAADAFALWNKAGGRVMAGLVRRRQEEAMLYLKDEPLPQKQPDLKSASIASWAPLPPPAPLTFWQTIMRFFTRSY